MDTSKAKKKTKKEGTQDTRTLSIGDVAVENVRVVEGKNGDIVFFTLVLNGLYIYNCRVATGKNGDFISWPQQKGKDDKYYNVCYGKFANDDEKDIIELVQNTLDNQ